MTTFAALLDSLRGDMRPRVIGDLALTGDALHARVEQLADAFTHQGVQRVASRMDNGPQWLAVDLALRRLGAVHVPLPTFFTPAQMQHALASSGAQCLIMPVNAQGDRDAWLPLGDGIGATALHPGDVVLPGRTACITYTSGTTGNAKGVCLDAHALLTVAASLVSATRPLAPRRHLCLMPLSTLLENVAGLYATLIAEAEIAVPSLSEIGYSGSSGLDVPSLVRCLHRYQPESVILLPQLLLALVMAAEAGAPLPASLRFIAVGGGRVGTRLIERALAVGLPVYEGYGLTECASVVCLNRPEACLPGSVGQALSHARVTEIDGELHVAGARCLGYLDGDSPAAGTIATGDLGHVDGNGFVHVTGRKKNVFITSFGRNVSPEWIESELLQHPLLSQAVVSGEARPYNVAVISPRRNDIPDDHLRRALVEVNQGLPDYAHVADFIRADAPFSTANGLLTSNGRVRRDAVLASYADAIDRRYPAATFPLRPAGVTP